jgi:aspartate kinase
MKVFKFGGASVKDAASVKNVLDILKRYPEDYLLVVISAMGKTTNRLEALIQAARLQDAENYQFHLSELQSYHQEIIAALFPKGNNFLQQQIDLYYKDLNAYFYLYENERPKEFYDAVIRYGELLSTRIVSTYLDGSGLPTDFVDASDLVVTDNHFQSATVDMDQTKLSIIAALLPKFELKRIVVTQGFIGRSASGEPTTLGREGSDYSGAIFAYCLEAESLTIWKDVEGMYNADPRQFPRAVKIDELSYKDAIELSYYGASVIHPKTIQPLQNKKIPLYVKSFLNPALAGTAIFDGAKNTIPCYIVKKEQVLVSLSTKNFAFIVERHLSHIFDVFAGLGMKINIMQNSAVNFSALFDAKEFDAQRIISVFDNSFSVRYNENLELVTIRHFDDAIVHELTQNRKVLLEQRTRETVRFVLG